MTKPQNRLLSLDAFRGLTIAGMILVNNPGSWGHIYSPLRHARWHGCTPTDLVFPFFLFIVGVAMAFSFAKRRDAGAARWLLVAHVARRSLILFLLGLGSYGFPNWRLIAPFIAVIAGLQLLFPDKPAPADAAPRRISARAVVGIVLLLAGVIFFILDFGYFDESGLRVPGVLQRIALCYFVASLIVIFTGIRGAAIASVVLVVGYALIVAFVPAPTGFDADVTGPEGRLHDWVDMQYLEGHLYRERPDPEGLLSTLGAIATTLLGVLAGWWLRQRREGNVSAVGLFVAANVCLFVGLCFDLWMPFNKKIWTSSYVIYTAGLALHTLAMCFWLIDVRGWRRWCEPLLVFGSNAIVVFIASGLLAKMLHRWKVREGGPSIGGWVYQNVFTSWASPNAASLMYAITYILLWLAIMYPLFRRRVFIKI